MDLQMRVTGEAVGGYKARFEAILGRDFQDAEKGRQRWRATELRRSLGGLGGRLTGDSGLAGERGLVGKGGLQCGVARGERGSG